MRRLLMWLALFVPFIVIPPTVHGQPNQTARKAIDLQELVNFKQDFQHTNFEKLEEANLAYFQFTQIPDEKQLAALKAKGLKVMSYSSNKTYLLSFPNSLDKRDLIKLGIVAFAPTKKEQKLAANIRDKVYPAYAMTGDNRLKIAINFHEGFSKNRYHFLLEKYDIEILEDQFTAKNIITIIAHLADIDLIAEEPLVAFVDLVTPPVEQLNHEVKALQKISYVNSANGYNLKGNGVVVGIGDGGELGDHLDFQDRVINYANGTYSSFGDHGDHVSGIVGGGGQVNPRHKGMAPEATVLTQKTSLVTYYAEDYYNDHGMILTNNSYGTSFNCATNGTYNYTSQNLDLQMRNFPDMLHVFAAGNSGSQTCSPYPAGYFTLLKFYQSAKNVLTVGNVTDSRIIKSNSSRGPASDGRLKPEICGIGTSVTSTSRNFDYSTKTGTSMAAPSVTGTMALLYESYRNENGNANPQGGLMKAVACNTADDLGNDGPDYIYGFGLINARRAISTIQDGRHLTSSISNGDSNTHTINVPANTKEVKVMLYWTDKEAVPYPVKALVNNLDVEVTTSNGTNLLPWVLNFDPAHVADLATRQVDSLNNIEQVSLDNPPSGNYTISVTGTEIPEGPQEYYIVYEFVAEDVVLTHPMGEEPFGFSEVEPIQWDTDNNNTSTFTVEYSLDGGSNWIVIDNNVAADQRSLFWAVPSNVTESAFVKVSKNIGGYSDSNATAFSIYDAPVLLTSPACEGRVFLDWNEIGGVDHYEVLKYEGTEMVSVGTTMDSEYTVIDSDMVLGEQYWFAVKGIKSGGLGSKRSIAMPCIPTDDAACDWSNDILAEAIIIPLKGRIMTGSGLTSTEVVSLQVRNIGDNEVSGIDLSYRINNGSVVTEHYAPAIASGELITYIFDQVVDMSLVGGYTIDAWVNFGEDININNDSIIGQTHSEQLANPPIDLEQGALAFDFELSNSYTYNSNEIGLTELIRWDFETEVDGTMVAGSSNSIELLIDEDASVIDPNYSNNGIITVNLSDHDLADGLELGFVYSNNNLFPLEEGPELLNKAYVRGSDSDSWIEAYAMLEEETGWHEVEYLNVGELLNNTGQSLSTSFQIRFEENGKGLLLNTVSIRQTSALPVELVSFNAIKIGGDALLKWKTASELNNERFEIQVATSVEQIQNNDFKVLGTIPGMGTSVEPQLYTYLDITPNKNGYYYYRLKQLDYDGKFDYSEIRELEFSEEDYQIESYPNPFTDYVTIGSDQSTFSNLKGRLYNTIGQLVDEFEIPASGHSGPYRFDIRAELPGGSYFLHLEGESGSRRTIALIKAE
ncbi:MAG: hypothetical protein ACI9XB_003408 [Gammaproteobacteria bacterium]|jgi:hypothetical protein